MTLPALAGMFARLYMDKYGVTPEHLAMVAIKNHENAMKNPDAHIQQTVTMEGSKPVIHEGVLDRQLFLLA